MPPVLALATSIALLGGLDTYLTATVLPIPVWVTFIVWASFFACGGGVPGFVKSIASNWAGILIASTCLLVISDAGLAHPALVAGFSMLVGALFGIVSEVFARALTQRPGAAAPAR